MASCSFLSGFLDFEITISILILLCEYKIIKMISPSLKPIHLKEHTCKQGHYGDIVPKTPMISMIIGPSGSGKTVLFTNMIFDSYKGCLSRIDSWSPSIEVDST